MASKLYNRGSAIDDGIANKGGTICPPFGKLWVALLHLHKRNRGICRLLEVTRAGSGSNTCRLPRQHVYTLGLLFVTPDRNYFLANEKLFSADGIFVSPDGIVGTKSPMPHRNSLFALFE